MVNLSLNSAGLHKTCLHCQRRLETNQQDFGFCCHGCEAVHSFIKSNQFGKFYDIAQTNEREPASISSDNLVELFDDPDFRKDFAQIEQETLKVRLYVGGLSCYACIWLIEKAFRDLFPTVDIRTSLSTHLCQIEIPDRGPKLSEIVKLLRQLGFRISPASEDAQTERTDELVRLGVSTFCFLNVMLLSIPDYIDADFSSEPLFWNLFRYMMLVLSTIVVSYGTLPMYRKAWTALKWRRPSIDLSIIIAILFTTSFSVVNTLRGQGEVYFDSICSIVTLIGWGRFFQASVMRRAEQSLRGIFDYGMQYVRQIGDSGECIIPLSSIHTGDSFFVLPGDPIPIDARVVSGTSSINYEQLTGESKAHYVEENAEISAGALNMTARLELEARQIGKNSVIAKLTLMVEEILAEKGRYTEISDRLGLGFFVLVMIVAAAIFASFAGTSIEEAATRSIAALLIACPCAFAIAVPLTMATCLVRGTKLGIILKSQSTIEKLAGVRRIFFDKTGTLTKGQSSILLANWHGNFKPNTKLTPNSDSDKHSLETCDIQKSKILLSLRKLKDHSAHHVVANVSDWALENLQKNSSEHCDIDVANFKETVGSGSEFRTSMGQFRLGKASFCGLKSYNSNANVFLTLGNQLVLDFEIDDQLHANTKQTINWIKNIGIEVGIISGDNADKTSKLAEQIGIDPGHVYSNQDPMAKMKPFKNSSLRNKTAMVGNGFNDTLALSQANVGIAVAKSSQSAKDAADAFAIQPGVLPVAHAIFLCRVAQQKIRRAFGFAVTFNLLGLGLAAMGMMHPVVAAILMPISSICVTLIAVSFWPKFE